MMLRREISGARCVLAVAWLVVTVLSPAAVQANARSQVLYAKGLIPFHAERWEEAYRLFDEAARADPNDALALYYRGLTAARLGFPDAAAQNLQRALELWPDLPGAPLDLGIVYCNAQQYEQAEPWLQRAYQQPWSRFAAALFIGLSRYRRGDDAGAHQFLSEAATDPELRAAAEYYDALVRLRQRETAAAREALAQVQTEHPDTEMGRAAAEFLSGAAVAPPLAEEAVAAKPWSLRGHLGFEYDSNVKVAPDDSGIQYSRGYGRQSDGRAVLGVGGSYRFLDLSQVAATASYDLSQSAHFKLTAYDLHHHRLRLDVATPPRRFQLGLGAGYNFSALDYQSFYHEGIAMPWLTVFEGRVAATQLYYRLRSRDYFRGPLDPFLDAYNHAVGLRQYLLLGAEDRVLDVGYQFDDEDPISRNGNDFQYAGHQFDVRVQGDLGNLGHALAAYVLRVESYDSPNSRNASGFARHDAQHQFVARFERALTEHLTAHLTYLGAVNGSNTDEFRYDRHIVSVGVEVRL